MFRRQFLRALAGLPLVGALLSHDDPARQLTSGAASALRDPGGPYYRGVEFIYEHLHADTALVEPDDEEVA